MRRNTSQTGAGHNPAAADERAEVLTGHVSAETGSAARRAQKILREITRSVKLKQRMEKRLGMTPRQASAECGDEIY